MTNPMCGELKNPLSHGKLIGPVKPETYHKSSAERGKPEFIMSRSELMEFGRCPSRWIKGYESEETKSTEWGTLIDGLVLGGSSVFAERFAITPETYTAKGKRKDDPPEEKPWNRNATFCREWEENQIGKTCVKGETFKQAQNATKFLFGDPAIRDLIQCSQYQVMVMASYTDPETGIEVPIKTLLDLLPSLDSQYCKCLADLKTCNSAAQYPWTKAVFDHGYHVQAALYLDAYTCATGEDRTDFLHVLQESYPPWQTGKRMLSMEFIEIGRMKYIDCLKRYCQCLETGLWPDYEDGSKLNFNGWTCVSPEAYMAL